MAVGPTTPDSERIRVARAFIETIPYNVALGLSVVRLTAGKAVMRVPYANALIGEPESGAVHGGVLSTLVDACGGAAVFTSEEPQPIATLDLRVDYLRATERGRDLIAHAECYRVTRNVAFVRGEVVHEGPRLALASFVASYMMGTRRGTVRTAATEHLRRGDP